jgi:hypothetical protein
MHSILVRYLQAKSATCKPVTVSGIATRLAQFGRVIADIDPKATPDTMNRVGHIEPWLAALPGTGNRKTGGCRSEPSRAVGSWPWRAPVRHHRMGLARSPQPPTFVLLRQPRLPQTLPRYLPPDADRRLTVAFQAYPYWLAADALLLKRACCASASCSTSNSTRSSTSRPLVPG